MSRDLDKSQSLDVNGNSFNKYWLGDVLQHNVYRECLTMILRFAFYRMGRHRVDVEIRTGHDAALNWIK